MKLDKVLRNRNFIIIAALVVVIAVVMILARTLRPSPSVPADAQQVEFQPDEVADGSTGETTEAQPVESQPDEASDDSTDDAQPAESQPENASDALTASAYVLCSLPASGQYGLIPLPEEGEVSYPIHQSFTDGSTSENIIHLTPEGFYMEFSTCQNQNCVQEGTVTLENREERALQNAVICLPNQVMAELYTREEIEAMDIPALKGASAGSAGE